MVEFLLAHHFLCYLLIVVCSVSITLLAIPSILHVAVRRHLYDDLGHFRKEHDHGIPRLGGVAIFVSFTITMLLFGASGHSLPVNYLITACIILFAMGLKDDLYGVNPSTKFLMQFFAAFVLVVLGDIRLTSMYGVLGIYTLPYFVSVVLSIVTIVLLINAFNLIDGIDGLAATTGMIVNGSFAAFFTYIKEYELAAVSIAMVGAIFGFLRFNLTPAKIFMGDTGSLLIGLISSVMAIKFIETVKLAGHESFSLMFSAPALTFAILIGPIFDTLRIFTLRIMRGVSPFSADRNHVHHRMLRLGFTHLQTTGIMAVTNLAIIGLTMSLSLSTPMLILIITAVVLFSNWMITFMLRSKEREQIALRNLFV